MRRGRWSNHERMPVTLVKHRAQVLVDLVRDRFPEATSLTGTEIGVYLGETSAILLRELEQLHLYMVDPWRAAVGDTYYWLSNAGDATMNQQMFDAAMLQAARVTEFAAGRRTLVPCPSVQAAPLLADMLDFIFVDGDHSYHGALEDIEAWWPRLAPRGLMTGHDYAHPEFPGVKKAVDEFALRYGLTVRTAADMVWYYDPPN